MNDKQGDFVKRLVEICRTQIYFYKDPEHPEQRTGSCPSLWMHRITQIEKGKVVDGETRDWLNVQADVWEERGMSGSEWVRDLAGTYKGTVWSV